MAKRQTAESAAAKKAVRAAAKEAKRAASGTSQTRLKPPRGSSQAERLSAATLSVLPGPATPSQAAPTRSTARAGLEDTPQSKFRAGPKAAPIPVVEPQVAEADEGDMDAEARVGEAAAKRRPRKHRLFATPSESDTPCRSIVDLFSAIRQPANANNHNREPGGSSACGEVAHAEEPHLKHQVCSMQHF
jgi:hypothetical protein